MLITQDSGTGPLTLIFLHFFGSSSKEWKQVTQQLVMRFRCVTVDAPGFGDAAGIPGYTVNEMAGQLSSLLHGLRPARCVLVGHSMTGKVAMVVAHRQPDNLAGLVAVAPSPLQPEPISEEARTTNSNAQQSVEAARAYFVNGAHRPLSETTVQQGVDDVMRANPAAWTRWPNSGAREDWSMTVERLALPSLLIVGEHDQAIPLPFQKEHTLPRLSAGRLEVIPDAAHLLPYETPDLLASLIGDFAASVIVPSLVV